MASSTEYLDFILEQLSLVDEITHRPMMGEYIIYCQSKVIGGIYDDRFLIKTGEATSAFMRHPILEIPYEGAKPMILVDNLDDKEYLATLISILVEELPEPKRRRH